MKYSGCGNTPEEACKDLEGQLRRDSSVHAFVTISDLSLTRKLSPRGLNRYAMANIQDGKDYRIKFTRVPIGKIRASVEFGKDAPICPCVVAEEELVFSPRKR